MTPQELAAHVLSIAKDGGWNGYERVILGKRGKEWFAIWIEEASLKAGKFTKDFSALIVESYQGEALAVIADHMDGLARSTAADEILELLEEQLYAEGYEYDNRM